LGGNRSSGLSILQEKNLGKGVGIRLKGGRSSASSLSIDYDAIARVVEKYKSSLIYLYNKELRSNPTLKGAITVEFSIDSKGRVVEANVVTSSMDYSPLETALAKRIKMWKFPQLYDGIIVVTYPFVFFPV
jgi:TonB family protein